MPASFIIRPVEPADRPRWEPLWRGYLTFYKANLSPQVTETLWGRFFDGIEPVQALVAGEGQDLIGIVHYVFHRSTWMIGPNCYLQDLFTDEKARGKGVGGALINAVYERAVAAGASRRPMRRTRPRNRFTTSSPRVRASSSTARISEPASRNMCETQPLRL